jgi:hypothetical protein
MNFATSYVTGRLRGVGPNGNRLFTEIRNGGGDSLLGLVDALLPGTDASELMAVIRDDFRDHPPEDEREGRVRALSLILGSPHFQMH